MTISRLQSLFTRSGPILSISRQAAREAASRVVQLSGEFDMLSDAASPWTLAFSVLFLGLAPAQGPFFADGTDDDSRFRSAGPSWFSGTELLPEIRHFVSEGGDDRVQGPAAVSASSAGTIWLNPSKLREIKAFVETDLTSQSVPADVVSRVLMMMDLAAQSKPWSEVLQADFPPPREFPSVAGQLKIQATLNAAAQRFRQKYPTGNRPPNVDIDGIDSGNPGGVRLSKFLRLTPGIVAMGQGGFSEEFTEVASSYRSLPGAKPRRDLGRWSKAITLSATGDDRTDRLLAQWVKASQAGGQTLVFKGEGMSPPALASIFIPAPKFAGNSLQRLHFCVEQAGCDNMAFISHGIVSAKPPSASRKLRFLERLYLAQPYNWDRSIDLIEVDVAGKRLSAYCDLRDSSPQSVVNNERSLNRELTDCLSKFIR